MFSVIFKAIFLVLSLYGYISFFSRKIKPELAIGFVMASIGSLTFLGGIIGPVYLAVKVILIGGIVCLVFSCARHTKIKNIITPGTIFFVLMCCVLLYIVYGAYFIEQDNFTHWAYVSKFIIRNDRFPWASDPNILFPSYPLGSASFIYFFCEALGAGSEWFQMFIQNVLSAGMLTALFAFAANTKQRILALLCSIFMLACYIGFRELLVDNLLAIVGFGGLAFCIYYKNELEDKVWYTVPYMVLLMSIKNSGLLFALYMIMYMLIYIKKHKSALVKLALCSTTPFIALFMWQQWHVVPRFGNGLSSKHSLSLQNFRNVFGDKTPEDIRTIFHLFIGEAFSLSNCFIYVLVFIAAVLLVNRYLFRQDIRPFKEICLLTIITYVVYQVGQFGMFMFTMPTVEALELACYDRYHRTILCFIAGLICIGMMQLNGFTKIKNKVFSLIPLFLFAVTLYLLTDPYLNYYKRQHIPESHHRAILNSIIEEYSLEENAGYVIITSDDYYPPDPLKYCARYLLGYTAKTKTLQDIKDNPSIFDEYPYVIIYSETDEITDYVESVFSPGVPRVFYGPDYR